MSFQDAVARDNRKVFLAPSKKEFARVRCVSGKDIPCDLEETKEATIESDGVSLAEYNLFAAYEDLPPLRVGETLVIDEQAWGILSFRVDGGIANVHIARRS